MNRESAAPSTATPADVLALARRVVADVVAPRAAHHDQTGEFPAENFLALGKAGLLGLFVPKRYGGLEVDYHSIMRARPSQNSDQISEVAAGQQLKAYPGTYPSEDSDGGTWYYVEMDQGWKVDGYISSDLVHVV